MFLVDELETFLPYWERDEFIPKWSVTIHPY